MGWRVALLLITTHVYGKAVPQGSKNLGRYGNMYESGKGLKQWRLSVAWHMEAAMKRAGARITDAPVALKLRFHVKIPQSRSKALEENQQHVGKPDADKLARAVLDALTGVLYEDDGQVYRLDVEKRYASEPGVSITAIIE